MDVSVPQWGIFYFLRVTRFVLPNTATSFSPSVRDFLFLTRRSCWLPAAIRSVSVPQWGIFYFLRWKWYGTVNSSLMMFQSLSEGFFISYAEFIANTYSDATVFQSLIEGFFISYFRNLVLLIVFALVSVPHWGIFYFLPVRVNWKKKNRSVSVPHWGIFYFLLANS